MARRGAAAKGTWRPRRKPTRAPADGDGDGDAADRRAEGGCPPPKVNGAADGGAGGGFFCCYLLRSLCPRSKSRTYIGFTVNPRRRIRQRNGEIVSGEWRTRRGRPWDMVLCIYGFPSNVAALQFEWAWQQPTESLAVRKVAAEFKSLGSIGNKVKLAYTMVNLPSWEKKKDEQCLLIRGHQMACGLDLRSLPYDGNVDGPAAMTRTVAEPPTQRWECLPAGWLNAMLKGPSRNRSGNEQQYQSFYFELHDSIGFGHAI